MWELLVIFVAMAVKDVLQALYVRFVAGRHPWLAGAADGITDLLSYGAVGVSVYDYPHRTPLWMAAALALLFVGSVLGTRLGYAAERRLEGGTK